LFSLTATIGAAADPAVLAITKRRIAASGGIQLAGGKLMRFRP